MRQYKSIRYNKLQSKHYYQYLFIHNIQIKTNQLHVTMILIYSASPMYINVVRGINRLRFETLHALEIIAFFK